MLFRKKRTAPEPKPVVVFTVPHSKGFRGYKRIKLATYKDEIAQEGLRRISAADSIGRISLSVYELQDTPPFVRVEADGNRAGTMWNDSWKEYIDLIRAGRCSSAHLNVSDDNAYLFVKFD